MNSCWLTLLRLPRPHTCASTLLRVYPSSASRNWAHPHKGLIAAACNDTASCAPCLQLPNPIFRRGLAARAYAMCNCVRKSRTALIRVADAPEIFEGQRSSRAEPNYTRTIFTPTERFTTVSRTSCSTSVPRALFAVVPHCINGSRVCKKHGIKIMQYGKKTTRSQAEPTNHAARCEYSITVVLIRLGSASATDCYL